MDQVRKALAWLKQYHFWVLSVLVVLIGLGCWWSASGALRKKYEENHQKIAGGFSSLHRRYILPSGAYEAPPIKPGIVTAPSTFVQA